MIERLEQLTNEVAALHSKLILLVGKPEGGKSETLELRSEGPSQQFVALQIAT